MNKRFLLGIPLAMALLLATSAVTVGDPADYDKKVTKGIYYLVTKDSLWDPQPRSGNAFAKCNFSIDESDILTVRLVAHKLTAGNWYFVELVDKSSGWNPLNPQDVQANVKVQFYGQADGNGTVKISFSWDIGGDTDVEINMKNADWVPKWDDATLGDPAEWIYTGQGWDYVLYGMALL